VPTIGHYEVLEKLGEGGMGVVWKARDTRLERFVALKLLPAAMTADPERRRRFVLEARAASALNHPNIVTIYDIDHADGNDFIAMEYVAGKTLDRLIPKQGLRVGEALKYAVQIADALAAAHAAGIVHRDLKPGNVMVSERGVVKVLDFGLAKLIETSPTDPSEFVTGMAPPKTQEGTILGTVAYMSPEQAEAKKVDARSDIFSFGTVLYEMLTGRNAFHGDSTISTLAAILRSEPEPLETQAEGIPRELARIVQRCLRKDPERRSQSLAELKLALEELKEDSESGAIQVPVGVQRKRNWLPLLAAALALVVIGAAAFRFWPGKTMPEIPLKAVPLTAFPGFERRPAFSPDGSQVAFSWNGEKGDNYDIYVQLIGSGRPLRLTTDPGADTGPVWSPDGRSITFVRSSPGRESTILSIPPLGGSEREIALEGASLAANLNGWTPDGRWLLVSLRESADQLPGLFLLSVDNGEKRRLTSPPAGVLGDVIGSISPDGHTLAFERRHNGTTSSGYAGDIYTLALTGNLVPDGNPKHVTLATGIGGLAWTADGADIVFSSTLDGAPALWRTAVSGAAKPQRLPVGEDASSLAISPRANRLVYEKVIAADLNIWRLDLSSPAAQPTALIASTRTDASPQYSPDGRHIAFRSDRSGRDEIWTCDADGSNAAQLSTIGNAGSPHWSPDSGRIAFDANVQGRWQVFSMSAHGGQAQQLTSGATGGERPSWSHDGKWIYFASNRSGRLEVWKMPSGGGPAVQLSRHGGQDPAESEDGTAVYYDAGMALMRVGVDGSGETKVFDGVSSAGAGSFAVAHDGIYYRTAPPDREYRFFGFRDGKSRTIQTNRSSNNGVAVSPDGHWLLYTQADGQPGSDLMLVENFR